MNLSKERFNELISLYLDNEASKEELELLADLINEPALARIFYEACKVHIASCKMYGKEVRLRPLIAARHTTSPTTNFLASTIEWGGVAFLAMISVFLSYYSGQISESRGRHPIREQIIFDSNHYSASINNQISSSSDMCGFIEFSAKNKLLKIKSEQEQKASNK